MKFEKNFRQNCNKGLYFHNPSRDPNFREKLNAKAKRKRNFFRKKMRSESEANLLLLNAKKCEANPFQKMRKKCENPIKNAKILRKFLMKL